MLRKELIVIDVEGSSDEEVLRSLGARFVVAGVAKESFPDALVERERRYPTALPATAFAIAVPHTFKEHIKEPAMGVGILAHPVAFHQMGSPEITLQVELLFMLAVKDPAEQIATLKQIMKLIQNEEMLKAIKHAASVDEVYEMVSSVLN